jgi:hypothetical protein
MSVVRHEAGRRWAMVLASVAVLCAVPVAVSAWPGKDVRVDAHELRSLMKSSAKNQYVGYAESVGTLGLPELPRFGQVADLVSGNTKMRAWYAAKDRWRVDVIDTGQERGTYRTPEGTVNWDYGANQLSQVNLANTGAIVLDRSDGGATRWTIVTGESANRLPRGADILPPDLARRLLDLAEGDTVTPIPGRRVAGVDAAGLRVTTSAPQSTIGHIDIWADPKTGLPLQVSVTARNAERPILETRFLDIRMARPSDAVLTPPQPREGLSGNSVDPEDSFNIFDPGYPALPETIAGLARSNEAYTSRRDEQGELVFLRREIGTAYGAGLNRIAVLPLNRRLGNDVLRGARSWGKEVTLPDTAAVLIAAPLLSVMVVHVHSRNQTYLLVGMVDGVYMERFGTALAASR